MGMPNRSCVYCTSKSCIFENVCADFVDFDAQSDKDLADAEERWGAFGFKHVAGRSDLWRVMRIKFWGDELVAEEFTQAYSLEFGQEGSSSLQLNRGANASSSKGLFTPVVLERLPEAPSTSHQKGSLTKGLFVEGTSVVANLHMPDDLGHQLKDNLLPLFYLRNLGLYEESLKTNLFLGLDCKRYAGEMTRAEGGDKNKKEKAATSKESTAATESCAAVVRDLAPLLFDRVESFPLPPKAGNDKMQNNPPQMCFRRLVVGMREVAAETLDTRVAEAFHSEVLWKLNATHAEDGDDDNLLNVPEDQVLIVSEKEQPGASSDRLFTHKLSANSTAKLVRDLAAADVSTRRVVFPGKFSLAEMIQMVSNYSAVVFDADGLSFLSYFVARQSLAVLFPLQEERGGALDSAQCYAGQEYFGVDGGALPSEDILAAIQSHFSTPVEDRPPTASDPACSADFESGRFGDSDRFVTFPVQDNTGDL